MINKYRHAQRSFIQPISASTSYVVLRFRNVTMNLFQGRNNTGFYIHWT